MAASFNREVTVFRFFLSFSDSDSHPKIIDSSIFVMEAEMTKDFVPYLVIKNIKVRVLPCNWGAHSTVDSIFASRPAAPGLILGFPKIFSKIISLLEKFLMS